MKLSIVTTLYYSAAYIMEFHERISQEAQKITSDYEIIYVNDGSPDNAVELAYQLYESDEHVCVVNLSRNFGHHKAAMTGLAYADGDLILLIDVDLEEPPELLGEFYAVLQANPDADVVYGQQTIRDGSVFRQWTGGVYYRTLKRMTGLNIPRNLLMSRLMTRRYVYHLVRHAERRYSIEGLWEITGFKQVPFVVNKTYKGETTYSIRKRIALAINGITSLSNKPLIYIAYLGLLLTIPSGLYILVVIGQYLVGYTTEIGWTSVIVSVWFLGGLNILVLGVIAIYLSVIFDEVKERPYTIVQDVARRGVPTPVNPRLSQNPEVIAVHKHEYIGERVEHDG